MKLTQAILIVLFINGFIALSQFENNGYKNVIVSIHPDVADENGQDIIDNIKVCNISINYLSNNKILFLTSQNFRFFWLKVAQNYSMPQRALLTSNL